MAKVELEPADFERIDRPAKALRQLATEQEYDQQAQGIIKHLYGVVSNLVQKAFDEGRRFERNQTRG